MVAQKSNNDVVSIFVRGDVNQIRNYLENQGIRPKAQLVNLICAELQISDIKFLARQNFVEGFEWEWGRKTLLNDSMLLKNKVLPVHAGSAPLKSPFTGKGVISGVVDTGLDPSHRDFQNLDSSTRVLEIWDQTLAFDVSLTPSFGYGQVFDSVLINAGPIAHVDSDNHGTGVASVMAGNGWHSGELKGVAPASDLVIVELDFSGANLTASVDAFKYIYDVADAHGKPCVINASYGDYLGSHDGLDATSLYLDSLLNDQPGRLFVAAAGNSGDWGPYHLRHANSGITDTSFTWFEPQAASTPQPNTVWLDIWGDTSNMNQLQFSVGADHNTSFDHGGHLAFRNILADNMVGTTIVDSIMNGGKLTEVQIYTELRGKQYNMQIYLPGADSADYNYSLISTGTGAFDLWTISYLGINVGTDVVMLSDMVKDGLPAAGGYPNISHYQMPDSAQSIVSGFQCSPNVITVGQYVNRAEYTDFNTAIQVCPQLTDSLAMNSSAGPNRIGLMKPDVNSTGFWVMSALSVSTAIAMQGGSSSWRLIESGFHTRRAGTSFSSPAVAGIGALLLEKCPKINAQEFLRLLQTTSFGDHYTGSLPNYRWGYGKTDAFALLNATSVNPSVVGDSTFCFGESTTLSVDNVYAVYDWNGTGASPSLVFDSTDSGYLLVHDEFGCKSDSVWYNVVEFDSLIDPTIVDGGGGLVATNPADSIQWFGVGTVLDDTLFSISFDQWVYVEHIDSNGCSALSDSLFIVAWSVSENGIEYEMFPNPAHDKVNFSATEVIDEIELRDLQGKLLISKFIRGKNGSIDLHNLSSGTYVLKFISGKESHNSKIQITR
jgi:subtilisin family serine protease